MDKPLADSEKDFSKLTGLLKQAEEKQLVISSCHPRRFDPPYIWFKNNLERFREELGNPLELRLDFFYHKLSKANLHTGLLSDHFNHEIDFLNFLFQVDSFKATKLHDSQERYSASGIRNDGISFHFFGNRQLNSPTYHEKIDLRFEHGQVSLNTGSGQCLIESYENNQTRIEQATETDYIVRFYNLNDNFVQACLGKEESYLKLSEMTINTESGIELSSAGKFEFHI
jgi:predicted dehydrogenase